MKTITLCGSMKLIDQMEQIAQELKEKGLVVFVPNRSETKDYTSMSADEQFPHKHQMIQEHLDLIKKSDAILVVNGALKDIEGYIGANSFLEIGFAFCLNKKIFLLNPVPNQPNKVEIGGLLPVVINNDLTLIS